MLQDIGISIDFLDKTPEAQATKANIDKWDYIKLRSFWITEGTLIKVNKQFTEWENICKLCI